MNIRFLGVHNAESKNTRLVTLVIDNIIGVDTGCLTSELSFSEQEKLKAILVSHGHYDHICGIPLFGFNNMHKTTKVYTTKKTRSLLSSFLLEGTIYPNFTKKNSFLKQPSIQFVDMVQYKEISIESYTIQAIPVIHPLESVGFYIQSTDSSSVFYTGDTGYGLSDVWKNIKPDLLIMDCTFPNTMKQTAENASHLCPLLIEKELESFYNIHEYYPKVYLTHMFPKYEDKIRTDIDKINSNHEYTLHIAKKGEIVTLS